MPTRSPRRLLCQCLAGALGQTLVAKDLPANPAEWQSLLRFANAQVVAPLLRWALQENALTAELPTDIVEFLDAFYAFNLDDNRRYADQLAHLIQTLNGIGVRPVLLKGAATLVDGLYPTPGERFIGDIDILVPPHRLGEILNQLHAVGYKPATIDNSPPTAEKFIQQGNHHHYPLLISCDWPVGVELHVHPILSHLTRLLSSEEIMRDARPVNWRGGECLLPSPTHFVTHNIIHAFLVDYQINGVLALRQVFEFVHASRLYADQIDWDAIRRWFDGLGDGTALRRYVALAEAYLGFQTPPELPIGKGAQWWTRLHCALVETPSAIYILFLLGQRLRIHAHNLKNPSMALSLNSYVRFYRELCRFKTALYTSRRHNL